MLCGGTPTRGEPSRPTVTGPNTYVMVLWAQKNWHENKKTANIEKAVKFFLEEIEQKFIQIWRGN